MSKSNDINREKGTFNKVMDTLKLIENDDLKKR